MEAKGENKLSFTSLFKKDLHGFGEIVLPAFANVKSSCVTMRNVLKDTFA